MLRVAMLSKWHVHAAGYAKDLVQSGKVEIVAVWDEDAARGESWSRELGAEFIADLDTLLARPDIDAVICTTPTTLHTQVLTKAAKAGKHIFTEKALAPTMEECREIIAEIKKSGVTFTISYPVLSAGYIQLARRLIEDGSLGKVTFMRFRRAHSGVSNGWLPAYWFEEKDAAGGAMMDLGCHPMYILSDLCGEVRRITGLFNAPLGSKVDENAVAIMEFENGVLGVSETGFDSYSSPDTLEIFGTEGTFTACGSEVKLNCAKLADTVQSPFTPKLPAALPSPLMQFVDACLAGTGSPAHLGTDAAFKLTQLLELSYRADRESRIVKA